MILAKRAKTVFSETGASFGGIAHIYIYVYTNTCPCVRIGFRISNKTQGFLGLHRTNTNTKEMDRS